MVQGRDSSGRVVSLLNDGLGPASAPISPVQRHFGHRHQRSLTSASLRVRPRTLYSLPSTPCLSPQTSAVPSLSRSDSNDSRFFPTPSPITPSFGPLQDAPDLSGQSGKNTLLAATTAPLERAQLSRHVSDSMTINTSAARLSFRSEHDQARPPLSVTSNGPPPRHLYHSNSDPGATVPTLESFASTSSNTSLLGSTELHQLRLKKNQFPCPLAKVYDCPDFFTTSGHAARHAKKHTGKKDAFCPECNKAFTRKDNMEQHRRTHQTIKIPSTSTVAKDNRVKKSVSARPLNTHKLERSLTDSDIRTVLSAPDVMDYMPSPVLTSPASSRQYPSSFNSPVSAGPRATQFDHSAQPSPTDVPSPTSQGRPPLHRSKLDTALTSMATHRTLDSPISFAQPSPGLSNGLDALALVADHRRRSEEGTE